ncbi:type II secretion system F family protein [Christensenella timonensis]|uniref:type II secretion system F family protein n=1 Tax=Christensenella timonensis TaxID=1816678 RepID=UPI0013905E24|nr:type II secretion system F family protein [Christensenella timonensis]
MARYRYKAVDAGGQATKGTYEAENLQDFRDFLKSAGLYCLSYKVEREQFGNSVQGSIPAKELYLICSQLGVMLDAGIGVVKGLDVLCQQAQNAKIKAILLSVVEEVKKGVSFHQALADQGGAFPFYLISSVESGEQSGTLDKVMVRMADYFEKQYKTKAQIKSALTYPILLCIMCIGVVLLMLVVVVPKFLAMYTTSGAELPVPTQMLLNLVSFLQNYWFAVLAVVVGVVILVFILKSSPATKPGWDTVMLHFPGFGKMKQTILAARFAHTFSMLISSGLSMISALEIVSRVLDNGCMSKYIAVMVEDVKKGMPLSESIKKFDVFPPMFKSMIAIGEESGEMDELLKKAAAYYDEESDRAVKKMVSMIEPITLVVMGFIIGFIVISIIMPIYGMYQNIS